MLTSEAAREAARKEAAAKRALGEEQGGGAAQLLEGGAAASHRASELKGGEALTLSPGDAAASQLASQLEGGLALHLTPGRPNPTPNPGEEEERRCSGALTFASATPEGVAASQEASHLASQLDEPALAPEETLELGELEEERCSLSGRQGAPAVPSAGRITAAEIRREDDVREACPHSLEP
jgi:hypothetical protein